MTIVSPLERLTEPELAFSDVKTFPRAEILRMQLRGEITPISRIPERHMQGRVSIPSGWERGNYDRSRFSG